MHPEYLPRFLRGLASTSTGTVLNVVLGFLSLTIAVRYVPKHQFGIFVLIQVLASFFEMLSNLAMENISVTKFITSADRNEKIRVVNTAIYYRLIISLIISITILLAKPGIYFFFKKDRSNYIIIMIILYFILSSFNQVLLKIMQGFHKYKEVAVSLIINSVSKLILIIVLMKLLNMGFSGLNIALLVSFAISIYYQFMVIPIKKEFKPSYQLFKKIFQFGFPLGLNGALYFVYSKIGRFIIGSMISPISVAYYDIADKVPESISRMYEAFRSVYFPHMSELFSKKRFKETEDLLNASIRIISFLTIFLALGIMIFQKDIISILFSNRYLESAPAMSMLMLALSIGMVGNIMGTTLVAIGQSDKPVKINIIDASTSIVANLVLIPFFGFIGAAYAVIISRCVTNPFIVYFLIKANVKVNVFHYLKPLFAYLVCVSLFLLIRNENAITKIVTILLFLILCVILSVIKREDLTFLKTQA